MRTFRQYNKFVSSFKPNPKPEKAEKKPKKGLSYKRKNTGEKEIFESIFAERPHFCQICFTPIGDPVPTNFPHILPKGQNKYPKFKLNPDNILLSCCDCHFLLDHARKSIINSPDWAWVFELEDTLKERYKTL